MGHLVVGLWNQSLHLEKNNFHRILKNKFSRTRLPETDSACPLLLELTWSCDVAVSCRELLDDARCCCRDSEAQFVAASLEFVCRTDNNLDNESLQPGKHSFPYVTHVGTERLLPGAVDR